MPIMEIKKGLSIDIDMGGMNLFSLIDGDSQLILVIRASGKSLLRCFGIFENGSIAYCSIWQRIYVHY